MTDVINIPDKSWIVVADGTGAKLYSASVQGQSVSLSQIRDVEPQEELHSGPSGMRPPEQTDQQTYEAAFAHQLAKSLYSNAHAGNYNDLVVIADPQTLGQLRGIFHQEVTNRIVAEIPRTLTTVSEHDLAEALSRMLAD